MNKPDPKLMTAIGPLFTTHGKLLLAPSDDIRSEYFLLSVGVGGGYYVKVLLTPNEVLATARGFGKIARRLRYLSKTECAVDG